MLDWSSIIPTVLATLAGAGWLKTAHDRRKEKESHNKEMVSKEAEIISKMRESETKYTKEALDIFNDQVVKPIRDQSQRNAEKLARLEGAIDMAPTCRLFPDCVILRKLQASTKDYPRAQDGNP